MKTKTTITTAKKIGMQKIYTLNTAATASSHKRKPAAFSFRLLMILVLCLGAGKGWGQIAIPSATPVQEFFSIGSSATKD